MPIYELIVVPNGHAGESNNPDDYVRIQLPEAAQVRMRMPLAPSAASGRETGLESLLRECGWYQRRCYQETKITVFFSTSAFACAAL